MDGVFVDTEPLHYRSFVDIFEPLGIDVSLDYFYGFVGEPVFKNISDTKRDFQLDIDVKKYVEMVEHRYTEIVANEKLVPITGIVESMRLARILRMKVGLATTSPRGHFDLILHGVRKHSEYAGFLNSPFDAVVTGEDVKHKKPAPDAYIMAAQWLGVHPTECVAIEDSEAGVHSAKAAGCFCIARRTAYNKHRNINEADKIVSSIEEVVKAGFFIQ